MAMVSKASLSSTGRNSTHQYQPVAGLKLAITRTIFSQRTNGLLPKLEQQADMTTEWPFLKISLVGRLTD
jgi:hypothetical protein